MIYKIFLSLFLLSTQILLSQKVVKKTLLNTSAKYIQIDGANCFNITLETSKTNTFVVEATIDGEYKKDLLLNLFEEDGTVIVNTSFRPNFVNPNDKLSAHKVVSISLKIMIPVNKEVKVFGTNSNILAKGIYKNLSIILSEGQCLLKNVEGKVNVHTQSGEIKIFSNHADIKAYTKYGLIFNEVENGHKYTYTLNSVTGNIYLKKTE